MKVKMILPALTEALSPYFRPIKYSLFPPLGLATLAGYLGPEDEVVIQDEHVQALDLDDEPDLVVIQVYITSARRAYEIADHYRSRGVHVCLGGLHVTSLPDEAALHADSVFLGPGEETWPEFLCDFRARRPRRLYRSRVRTLDGLPPIRRDLIDRQRYLVPNSIVVSRGCPHACRGAISISSMIICSGIRDSRARFSTECEGWVACGRRRERCSRCCGRVCWSARSNPDYAACSSASRR